MVEMVVYKTISSAGTAEQLSTTSVMGRSFFLENPSSQSGSVYVADTQANAQGSLRHAIAPGERMQVVGDAEGSGNVLPIDLSDLWIDADNTGEGLVVSKISRRKL